MWVAPLLPTLVHWLWKGVSNTDVCVRSDKSELLCLYLKFMTRKWTIVWAFVKVGQSFLNKTDLSFSCKTLPKCGNIYKAWVFKGGNLCKEWCVYHKSGSNSFWHHTAKLGNSVFYLFIYLFLFYTRDWIKSTVCKLKVNITLMFLQPLVIIIYI